MCSCRSIFINIGITMGDATLQINLIIRISYTYNQQCSIGSWCMLSLPSVHLQVLLYLSIPKIYSANIIFDYNLVQQMSLESHKSYCHIFIVNFYIKQNYWAGLLQFKDTQNMKWITVYVFMKILYSWGIKPYRRL